MRTSGTGVGRTCSALGALLTGADTRFAISGPWLLVPTQNERPAITSRAALIQPSKSSGPRFTRAVFFGAGSSLSQGRRSRPPAVRLSLISTHLLGRGHAHQA